MYRKKHGTGGGESKKVQERLHARVAGIQYHKAPDELPGFKEGTPRKKMTPVQGGGNRRDRWKLPNGKILEWDGMHQHLEMYDKRGKHRGVFDQDTGKQIGPAVPGRTIQKYI